MADRISFRLRDATTLAPLLGAVGSLSFVDYRLAEAPFTQRTAPTNLVEIGLGEYGFTPTDADEAAGVVFLLDAGAGAEPRYVSGAIFTPASPFFGAHLEDNAGALWSGAAPTVDLWSDFTPAARTPPSVLRPTAYLVVVKPSSADLARDIAFVITSPTGAEPPSFDGSFETPTGRSITASPGMQPDALVIEALLTYLRRNLPAKVVQLNLLRCAVLKSALAEPFTIPVGAVLKVSSVSQEATPVSIPLTPGSVTAAQLVADFDAVGAPGLTASDINGHFALTADLTPADGVPSVVIVARDTDGAAATGSNTALGWAEGGEHIEVRALVAPSYRGVVDGRPLTAPDMGQGFWVMLGNRTTRATHPGTIRRDTYLVTVQCEVWRPFAAHGAPHRTREPISACVRAVRELINSDDGRYLGRQGAGDVQLADASEATLSGDPLQLSEVPGVLFDVARFPITVRVFQRHT